MSGSNGWIGKPMPRREDERLVRGQGKFVDDIRLPGTVHLHVVRTAYAHARIIRIDTTAAMALPGVIRILTHADLGPAGKPMPLQIPLGEIQHPVTQPPLAADRVAYAGQPVVAIVAEDRYIAEDAADLVVIEYEQLPVVTDPVQALAPDSPRVHPDLTDNLAGSWRQQVGDPEGAMAGADHRFTLELTITRGTGQPMETRGLSCPLGF